MTTTACDSRVVCEKRIRCLCARTPVCLPFITNRRFTIRLITGSDVENSFYGLSIVFRSNCMSTCWFSFIFSISFSFRSMWGDTNTNLNNEKSRMRWIGADKLHISSKHQTIDKNLPNAIAMNGTIHAFSMFTSNRGGAVVGRFVFGRRTTAAQ